MLRMSPPLLEEGPTMGPHGTSRNPWPLASEAMGCQPRPANPRGDGRGADIAIHSGHDSDPGTPGLGRAKVSALLRGHRTAYGRTSPLLLLLSPFAGCAWPRTRSPDPLNNGMVVRACDETRSRRPACRRLDFSRGRTAGRGDPTRRAFLHAGRDRAHSWCARLAEVRGALVSLHLACFREAGVPGCVRAQTGLAYAPFTLTTTTCRTNL